MATLPLPIIHHYSEINHGKFSSVKHYELTHVENGTSLLAEKINISKDRQFARSHPNFWLKIWQGSKWSKPITGLFKTSMENVFSGDRCYKKHLIVVVFSTDKTKIRIFYFQNFFTADLRQVLSFIKAFQLKPKRGAHNPS